MLHAARPHQHPVSGPPREIRACSASRSTPCGTPACSSRSNASGARPWDAQRATKARSGRSASAVSAGSASNAATAASTSASVRACSPQKRPSHRSRRKRPTGRLDPPHRDAAEQPDQPRTAGTARAPPAVGTAARSCKPSVTVQERRPARSPAQPESPTQSSTRPAQSSFSTVWSNASTCRTASQASGPSQEAHSPSSPRPQLRRSARGLRLSSRPGVSPLTYECAGAPGLAGGADAADDRCRGL